MNSPTCREMRRDPDSHATADQHDPQHHRRNGLRDSRIARPEMTQEVLNLPPQGWFFPSDQRPLPVDTWVVSLSVGPAPEGGVVGTPYGVRTGADATSGAGGGPVVRIHSAQRSSAGRYGGIQTPKLLIRSRDAPLLMPGIQKFHRAPQSPKWACLVMVRASS